MDILIHPQKLSGTISVPPSKSQAHRYLICAAFADKSIRLICPNYGCDIEATVNCLRALGANIDTTPDGFLVRPVSCIPSHAILNCGESGSTLRFLLPVAGALGVDAVFLMEGRLPQRPLSPLLEEMERMGCVFSFPSQSSIRCSGKLRSGYYSVAGNISSQFVSGLLFAAYILKNTSVSVNTPLESKAYVDMTNAAIALFRRTQDLPDSLTVEGDWSNGAFWLAANALGSRIHVENLKSDSLQGDCSAAMLIASLSDFCSISAENIPDLVPILAVVAAANKGAVFSGIERLRLKESDRVMSVISMICSLGGNAEIKNHTLIVQGTGLTGGTVHSFQDHRIAMAAAIASSVCKNPVYISDSECVRKSYPNFWDEFRRLGGNYEQHLR